MDNAGNIDYRNYYSSAKTEKAIGFKNMEDPKILDENYKNYHPLDGSNNLIKEFLMDEISAKHEASKLAKEIEADEEAERKRIEKEEAEIGALQDKIHQVEINIAKAEEKIGFLNSPEYNANMPEDEKKSLIKFQKRINFKT